MKKVLLLILLFLTIALPAQPLQRNQKAIDYLEKGKQLMRLKNYADAYKMFEEAMTFPENTSTTTVVYYAALCAHHNRDWMVAIPLFEQLLEEYPLTKYKYDALLHLNVGRIESGIEGLQMLGLYGLAEMRENADKKIPYILAIEATNAIKRYLYTKLTAEVLSSYYLETEKKYKQEALEALCLRMLKDGNADIASGLYEIYKAEGGASSHILAQLFSPERRIKWVSNKKPFITIAIVLPFSIPSSETEIYPMMEFPEHTTSALEFYEGWMMAMRHVEPALRKNFHVKVFDSQRNSQTVEGILQELEELAPDIILGDIYNRQSRLLSEWAEKRGIVQLIPLSPTYNLVEGKSYTYLMHPSARRHGEALAVYAYKQMHVKNVVIFTDGSETSQEMTAAFAEAYQLMGGATQICMLDSVFSVAKPQIERYLKFLSKAEGVYIPIDNDQHLSYLLAMIDAGRYNIKIMTLPKVMDYSKIDQNIFNRHYIYFTTSYSPDFNGEIYKWLSADFLRYYGSPPSEIQLRGYDIGMYLFSLLDGYTPKQGPLNRYIRSASLVQGVHNDIIFNKHQENQSIKVQQFGKGGLTTLR